MVAKKKWVGTFSLHQHELGGKQTEKQMSFCPFLRDFPLFGSFQRLSLTSLRLVCSFFKLWHLSNVSQIRLTLLPINYQIYLTNNLLIIILKTCDRNCN